MTNINYTLGRNDEFPLENFKKGAKVWIKDVAKVWINGELLENLSFAFNNVKVKTAENNIVNYDILKNGLPFLCNPEILLGKDDLTTLSYLHEPAVLNNLRYRFEACEIIYTYCGIVLVAINPYTSKSHLYNDEVIQVYRGFGKQVRDLDPHIYAIAEEAYYDMCEYKKNQSVIISGESGAGKTVSAKFVMRYLTSVASETLPCSLVSEIVGNSNRIESKVLASNPIMEAIGNAKTIRNDNSSRFGKFIKINFNEKFKVCGAEMKSYLLEKSRVVFHSKYERNYHIFYQMCASKNHVLLQNFNLLDSCQFIYTNNYGLDANNLQIEGIDDVQKFNETIDAFNILNISSETQTKIFKVIAGILYLGNIQFESDVSNKAKIKKSNLKLVEHLCSNLYLIDQSLLSTWLVFQEIRAGFDVIQKPLTVEEAKANRDAFAKVIYSCLFNWIVEQINENLLNMQDLAKNENVNQIKLLQNFIGVLDIYGFETFEKNSFEQFCINYANEKLQQQFNQHVFKLEQLEYEKEEISWLRIDFYDNQICIDLIESRPGIIDYLDEQCKTGRGTDNDWLNQMTNCKILQKIEHFKLPKFKNSTFIIKHFASEVLYSVDGFIEKNKDTVNEQLLNTLNKTKFLFLREIVKDLLSSSSTGVRRKKTIAIQFRDSLNQLIKILSSTRPHYVRCIKPNNTKTPFYFEPKCSIQQLRANGILETIRISAAGFPSRWTYKDFANRYRILYSDNNLWKQNSKEFAKQACLKWLSEEKFALGKTKIFLKTGQVALIEKIRIETLLNSAIKIQTLWRSYKCRKIYKKHREAVLFIQAYGKAFLIYRRIKFLQIHRAAIIIQAAIRGFVYQRRYIRIKSLILQIQCIYRGKLARKRFTEMKYKKSVLILQKYCRGWLVRQNRAGYLRKIIKIQCCVRRYLAKKKLKQLKMEAKSVSHLQNLNKGLEKKIINLQQRYDVVATERNLLLNKIEEKQKIQKSLHLFEQKFFALKFIKKDLNYLNNNFKDVINFMINQKIEFNDFYKKLKINFLTIKKTILEFNKNQINNQVLLDNLRNELCLKKKEVENLTEQLTKEKNLQKNLSKDLEQMQNQLLKNAVLLESSDLNRSQNSKSKIISLENLNNNSTLDLKKTDDLSYTKLLLEQQKIINEQRKKLDEKERIITQLQFNLCFSHINESCDKISSCKIYEENKIQDLNLKITKSQTEIQKLLKKNNVNQQFLLLLEKNEEENERLQDEILEMKALLSTHFERHCSQTNCKALCQNSLSQNENSCFNSTTSNEDQEISLLEPQSEVDTRLKLEREVRCYKQLLNTASKELSEYNNLILEKNDYISRLENRLIENKKNLTQNEDCNDTIEGCLNNSELLSIESSANLTSTTLESLVQENLVRKNTILFFSYCSRLLSNACKHTREWFYDCIQNLSRFWNFETATTVVTFLCAPLLIWSLQQRIQRKTDELNEARGFFFSYPTNINSSQNNFDYSKHLNKNNSSEGLRLDVLQNKLITHSALLEVFNIPEFVHILIYDLKPRIAQRLRPCTPAYFLLMAFRFYDHLSDDIGLTNLFNVVHSIFKDFSMNSSDIDVLVLWLVNSWCLLNLLRQYSNEENLEWNKQNTELQNSYTFQNFNLKSLRNQLDLRVKEFYSNLMKLTIEPLLTPKIVPAILQHKSYDAEEVLVSKFNNFFNNQRFLSDLLEFLSIFHCKLKNFGADSILIFKIFQQISHWIVALSLNHMMFRKEFCTLDKAISIKHNITEIQSWLIKKNICKESSEILLIFEPIIQASHLLQIRKTEANLDVLCGEATSALMPKQIIAILRHFTPSNNCFEEDVIDDKFLTKVTKKLMERKSNEKNELLMRGTYLEPFDTSLFVYSNVALETLTMPTILNLQSVARLI